MGHPSLDGSHSLVGQSQPISQIRQLIEKLGAVRSPVLLGHAVLHILTVHAALHVAQVTVWRRAVELGALVENLA